MAEVVHPFGRTLASSAPLLGALTSLLWLGLGLRIMYEFENLCRDSRFALLRGVSPHRAAFPLPELSCPPGPYLPCCPEFLSLLSLHLSSTGILGGSDL